MYRRFIKRLLDILISLVALPFVLLVIAICAPIIYLDDRGPVFYNATRRGTNGKNFTMYKLRSMYVNAPEIKNADGSTITNDFDPRVTRFGRFLRKFSVDEVPQFLNVLKGDMSLVGPRPTLAVTPYKELTEPWKKRLLVRQSRHRRVCRFHQIHLRRVCSIAAPALHCRTLRQHSGQVSLAGTLVLQTHLS